MPSLLYMARRYRQNVAFPFTGGKAHPSMSGVIGRMRTAIHINRAVLLVGADVLPQRNDLLGLRVALFPDTNAKRATVNIANGVNLALVLWEGKAVGGPAQRPLTRGLADRQAKIIDQIRTRAALRLVFVH